MDEVQRDSFLRWFSNKSRLSHTPHQSPAVTASPQGEAFIAILAALCYNTVRKRGLFYDKGAFFVPREHRIEILKALAPQ